MPLRFNRKVVRERGLPKLTLSSPPHLVACYRDQVKQGGLDVMVAQLVQKQCIREMSPTECGFFLPGIPSTEKAVGGGAGD